MKYLLIATLLCFCCSCNLRTDAIGAMSKSERPIKLRPIDAVLEEVEPQIKPQYTRVIAQAESTNTFTHAVFVNERRGWAGTNHLLYETSDGGDKWSRLSLSPGEDWRISSFTFVDESRGWLATTRQTYTERYGMGNSSQIWATTDGGNTWTKQADFPDEIKIKQIKFLTADHGFAIGARVIDRPRSEGPAYDDILVLKTVDGGRVWTDISDAAKTEIKNETGTTVDHGWNMGSALSTEMFLLTRNAALLKSSDHGKTWKTIARFEDERPHGFVSSVAFFKLVFDTEQQVRIIAGAQGDEGYWGDLVTTGEDNSWISYELRRMPLFDAIFLSKDEIVACGEERRSWGDKRSPAVLGIILHSLDGGKSWRPLYRSKVKEAFISISKLSDRKFYAVSDAGTLLKFAL